MSWCFGSLCWSPPYYRIYITIIVIITIIISSAEWRKGYVFTIVSFFVCLSVCLPVSNITEKRLNWFSWDFQGMRDLVRGTVWKFSGCSIQPLEHRISFRLFRRNPCLLVTLWETVEWIFMKFSAKDGHGTKNSLENFGILQLTPWILGRFFFLFPGSVFVSNIMENMWTDTHKTFMKCQEPHRN